MPSRKRLAAVAERAARAGGEYLRGEFRSGDVRAEFGDDDVKAAVDRAAERRVLDVITAAFPDHAIHAEESGRRAGEGAGDRYEWLVDPLDGTNNFAAGMPSFATVVAVREAGETVAAAIHEPVTETLYRARLDGGATENGAPTTAGSGLSLDRGTVSFAVGLDAVRDDAALSRARAAECTLRDRCKRVRPTWAPATDWGLLAAGRIEGMVVVRPEPYEHHAGTLLAGESGAVGGWIDENGGQGEDGRGREGDAAAWYVAAVDRETRRSLVAALDA